jgi:single-strand DNA-binding protein
VAGLNKCMFIGNLGRDPEVKFLDGGNAVTKFSVAVNESWKDKSGEKKERVEWVRVVAWGKLGELCGEYLKKGRQVFVEGRMQTREYEKNGEKKYSTEIVASGVTFLGGGGQGGSEPAPTHSSATSEPDDVDF